MGDLVEDRVAHVGLAVHRRQRRAQPERLLREPADPRPPLGVVVGHLPLVEAMHLQEVLGHREGVAEVHVQNATTDRRRSRPGLAAYDPPVTDREVVTGTVRAPRRARVREFVANRSYPTKLGALGVVLVLATAPFGGLRSAAKEDTRPLALGQRLDIGPFYVTVEKVTQLSDLQPAVSPDNPRDKLLVLKVKVTNH